MSKTRPLINFAIIARVVGWLLMIEAVFLLIPALTSLIYSESDAMSFAITAAITAEY